jgi:hypothetical protein
MPRVAAVLLAIAIPAPPAAAQAVWDARELDGGGAEFRLGNDEGAAIILACQLGGVSAGFEFPVALEATGSAQVRGVPGERHNVAVAPVNDRVIRVTTGRGIEVLLRLLQNTANLFVRAGGERTSFEVFGSAPLVSQCLERQDEAIRDPTRRFRSFR